MADLALRERFETWFKIAYPLFGSERDTTLKHQLWTAWQVASLPIGARCGTCGATVLDEEKA